MQLAVWLLNPNEEFLAAILHKVLVLPLSLMRIRLSTMLLLTQTFCWPSFSPFVFLS
jgi:hypothetical protein